MSSWPDDTALTPADLEAARHEGHEDREASDLLSATLDEERRRLLVDGWSEAPPRPLALVSRPERQKEGIVHLLEGMLEAAKRGEYRSFMAVAEWDSTGDLTWCWSGNDDLPGFAAKLDLLKQQTYRRLFRD